MKKAISWTMGGLATILKVSANSIEGGFGGEITHQNPTLNAIDDIGNEIQGKRVLQIADPTEAQCLNNSEFNDYITSNSLDNWEDIDTTSNADYMISAYNFCYTEYNNIPFRLSTLNSVDIPQYGAVMLAQDLATDLGTCNGEKYFLTVQVAELDTENTQLTTNLAECNQGTCPNLLTQIEQLDGENTQLSADLDACNTNMNYFSDQVTILDGENTQLSADLDACNADKEDLTAQVAELEADNADLTANNTQLTTDLGTCNAYKSDLEANNTQLTTDLGTCNADNADLTAQVATLEAQIAQQNQNDGENNPCDSDNNVALNASNDASILEVSMLGAALTLILFGT